MQGELACTLIEQSREDVRPRWELRRASAALDLMERELREILLHYGAYRPSELREHLRRALEHCQDIVDIIEAPALPAQTTAVIA